MNIAPQKLMIITVLVAILVAGAAAFWFIVPSTPDVNTSLDAEAVTESAVPTPKNDASFNTTVLERSDYTTLDLGLVKDNRLPVQPPATVGKPNPF